MLCNDAQLLPPENDPRWRRARRPDRGGAAGARVEGWVDLDALRKRHRATRNAVRFRRQADGHASRATGCRAASASKARPRSVLELCTPRGTGRHRPTRRLAAPGAQGASATMAARALRVLAFAEVEDFASMIEPVSTHWPVKPRLLGLVGQIDPPRDEVQRGRRGVPGGPAFGRSWSPATTSSPAWPMARALGIAREGDRAVDGRELERMGESRLAPGLERIAVFARVQPAQKLRIVAGVPARGRSWR